MQHNTKLSIASALNLQTRPRKHGKNGKGTRALPKAVEPEGHTVSNEPKVVVPSDERDKEKSATCHNKTTPEVLTLQSDTGATEVRLLNHLQVKAMEGIPATTLLGFLEEVIPVYEQRIVRTCTAGVVIEFSRIQDMPRMSFYRAFLRQYAFDVCNCKLALVNTDHAVEATKGLSAVQALDMYCNYLFSCCHLDGNRKDIKVGICSRDSVITDVASQIVGHVENERMGIDFLDAIGQFDGLSKHRAFTHNGGILLGGVQTEEGLMLTCDAMMDMNAQLTRHGIMCAADMGVLREVCKLSAKRWLVYKLPCSNTGQIQDLEAQVCSEFGEEFVGWEQAIQSKCYVLNPIYWMGKHKGLFDLVDQFPGQVLATSRARSCIGHSAFSLSWCRCDPALLKNYVDLEMDMASKVPPQAPERGVRTRGMGLTFSMVCEILHTYDAQYAMDPQSSYVQAIRPLAQHIYHTCMAESQAVWIVRMCRTSNFITAHECDMHTQGGQSIVCASCGFPLPFVAVCRNVGYYKRLFCGRCTAALWPRPESRRGCRSLFIRSHFLVGLHEYCS